MTRSRADREVREFLNLTHRGYYNRAPRAWMRMRATQLLGQLPRRAPFYIQNGIGYIAQHGHLRGASELANAANRAFAHRRAQPPPTSYIGRFIRYMTPRQPWNNFNFEPPASPNRRDRANIPENRNWSLLVNKVDPVSLQNIGNWNGNKAIEVKRGSNKDYFTLESFRRLFGNNWKNLARNSNAPIHPSVTHPLTRQPVPRKNVRLVKFTGTKP